MEFDRDHELLSGVEKFLLCSRLYVHEVWVEEWVGTPIGIKQFLKKRGGGLIVAMTRHQITPASLSAVAQRDFKELERRLVEADEA
jgi:hypothetical protein